MHRLEFFFDCSNPWTHPAFDGIQSIAEREDIFQDKLRSTTDALVSRGGFGSPTIFVDVDDMYFGDARLPLVTHKLES